MYLHTRDLTQQSDRQYRAGCHCPKIVRQGWAGQTYQEQYLQNGGPIGVFCNMHTHSGPAAAERSLILSSVPRFKNIRAGRGRTQHNNHSTSNIADRDPCSVLYLHTVDLTQHSVRQYWAGCNNSKIFVVAGGEDNKHRTSNVTDRAPCSVIYLHTVDLAQQSVPRYWARCHCPKIVRPGWSCQPYQEQYLQDLGQIPVFRIAHTHSGPDTAERSSILSRVPQFKISGLGGGIKTQQAQYLQHEGGSPMLRNVPTHSGPDTAERSSILSSVPQFKNIRTGRGEHNTRITVPPTWRTEQYAP